MSLYRITHINLHLRHSSWTKLNTNSTYVEMLMDNFATSMHLCNPLPTHLPVSQLYMPRTQQSLTRDAHSIWNTNSISIPMSIAPNVWILTSAPSAVTTGITLICHEVATRSITLQKPIHILQLPPACSANSPYFHLPPQ